MAKKSISIEFEEFENDSFLNQIDLQLLNQARKITENAYAPYSNFFVGAVAVLQNGQIITGTNQENASFPVGICAERTLLSTIASLFPGMAIVTLAISYNNKNGISNKPISPCGVCRQSLSEYEDSTNNKIRIILSGQLGAVQILNSAKDLLPLGFTNNDMK